MKIMEALRIATEARRSGGPVERTILACSFTPLHLQTFLQAHLQLRSPAKFAVVESGLYGDVVGTLGRAATADACGAIVPIEWTDLDPRLGLRTTGGWSAAKHPEILDSAGKSLMRLEGALRAAAESMPVIVSTPTLPLLPVFHTAGWQSGSFELALYATVAEFALRLSRDSRVRLVSQQRLDMTSPPAARADMRAELSSGFPYTSAHADRLAAIFAETLLPPSPKKGLITDLDDTLWSGILGDVGLEGISWSLDQKTHVHALYQQMLASLADAGVLVAIASKNDPDMVTAAFARADQLLRPEQVYPVMAHWKAKSESVTRILAAWNIGPESIVFVDDSPMEIAQVQAEHPQVECLLFPKDDAAAVVELLAVLRDRFGKPVLLDEDRLRAESLRIGGGAAPYSGELATASEEFLAEAGAEIIFELHTNDRDVRAFELVNKTNQFNLNGRRYTEAEWIAFLRRPGAFLLTVSYRDRFGQLGKVGVAGGRVRGDSVDVTLWVMSCRAFARRIEHQSLKVLFDYFHVTAITLDYVPTERNGPTTEFLTSLGLETASASRLCLQHDDFSARAPALYHAVQTLSSLPNE